jgi:hypothetical protein
MGKIGGRVCEEGSRGEASVQAIWWEKKQWEKKIIIINK